MGATTSRSFPKTLNDWASSALEQIKNHQYVAELVAHGISRKVLLGIACAGKKIKVVATGDVAKA